MRRILIVGLLLAATSAHADHVWRLWCGHPPTKRGASDSSEQCDTEASILRKALNTCADTPDGPRFNSEHLSATDELGLRTCAAVRRQYADCHCEREPVPEK